MGKLAILGVFYIFIVLGLFLWTMIPDYIDANLKLIAGAFLVVMAIVGTAIVGFSGR